MRPLPALLLASVLLASVPVAAPSAADAPQLRVAVIDVERVRRSAAAVKVIRTQLGTYLDVYRTDTEKEEQEIRAAQDELTRKRPILTPEGYAEERRNLETRLTEAQDRVQRRRQALERVNMDAMEQVKQALETIISEIAAERQLTLILRKDQTVFAAPALDVTDDVLKRLDMRLPSVRISDPGG